MKKIFKYKLPRDGEVITIRADVIKWLDVQEQNGWPHIWAIVEENGHPRDYEIAAWGTGWMVPDELMYMSYLGTAQDMGGYVWHYFVVPTSVIKATRAHSYDVTLQGKELKTEEDEFEIDEETVKAFHEQMLNYLRQPRLKS